MTAHEGEGTTCTSAHDVTRVRPAAISRISHLCLCAHIYVRVPDRAGGIMELLQRNVHVNGLSEKTTGNKHDAHC